MIDCKLFDSEEGENDTHIITVKGDASLFASLGQFNEFDLTQSIRGFAHELAERIIDVYPFTTVCVSINELSRVAGSSIACAPYPGNKPTLDPGKVGEIVQGVVTALLARPALWVVRKAA